MKTILILGLLAMSACTTTTPTDPAGPIKTAGCTLETSVAAGLANTIAATLNCTNISAIQADLLSKLGPANLCPAPTASVVKAQSIVGGIVCPIAVQSVMAFASGKIPAGWGCAPQASTATLSSALTASCMSLVGGP